MPQSSQGVTLIDVQVCVDVHNLADSDHNTYPSIVVYFHDVGEMVPGPWFPPYVNTSRIVVYAEWELIVKENIDSRRLCPRLILPSSIQKGSLMTYSKSGDADHCSLAMQTRIINPSVNSLPRN